MSVLIKGMKMPENCSECPVALSGKYCRINKTYTTYIKLPIRPNHCPLVTLPEKHGRLIDADALDYRLGASDRDIYVRYTVEEEPTVIEAEGE